MKKILFTTIVMLAFIQIMKAQWVQQTTGTFENFNSIQVINTNICFSLTDQGNLYKTINGGGIWNIVNTGQMLSSFRFLDSNTGFGSRDSIVYKTTDGGVTWNQISQIPNMIYIGSFNVINSNLIYSQGTTDMTDSIHIFKTTNSGINWSEVTTIDGWSVYEKSLYFLDSNTGFSANFNSEIYKTGNGGLNWNLVNPVGLGETVTAINFANSSVGYAPTEYLDILKTTDGGNTWNSLSPVLPYPLYDIYFISTDTGYAVGSDGLMNGGILKTTDGGATWALSLNANHFYMSLDFLNSQIGYTCAMGGYIYRLDTQSSIEDNEFSNNYIIYPNPTTTTITIESKMSELLSSIKIIDVLGKEIYYLQTENNKTEIDVSQLPSGIYILQMQNNKGVVSKKFVKE